MHICKQIQTLWLAQWSCTYWGWGAIRFLAAGSRDQSSWLSTALE